MIRHLLIWEELLHLPVRSNEIERAAALRVRQLFLWEVSMNIKVKKLRESAQMPTRGSASAAGYDLYADLEEDIEIRPGETRMIPTGLAMELPEGYFGAVFARSGLAMREGLRPGNCVGVVDSDYRGEFFIGLHNDSSSVRTVEPGERIAQLVILPFLSVTFSESESLSETERGEGGFGSTGKNKIFTGKKAAHIR